MFIPCSQVGKACSFNLIVFRRTLSFIYTSPCIYRLSKTVCFIVSVLPLRNQKESRYGMEFDYTGVFSLYNQIVFSTGCVHILFFASSSTLFVLPAFVLTVLLFFSPTHSTPRWIIRGQSFHQRKQRCCLKCERSPSRCGGGNQLPSPGFVLHAAEKRTIRERTFRQLVQPFCAIRNSTSKKSKIEDETENPRKKQSRTRTMLALRGHSKHVATKILPHLTPGH